MAGSYTPAYALSRGQAVGNGRIGLDRLVEAWPVVRITVQTSLKCFSEWLGDYWPLYFDLGQSTKNMSWKLVREWWCGGGQVLSFQLKVSGKKCMLFMNLTQNNLSNPSIIIVKGFALKETIKFTNVKPSPQL